MRILFWHDDMTKCKGTFPQRGRLPGGNDLARCSGNGKPTRTSSPERGSPPFGTFPRLGRLPGGNDLTLGLIALLLLLCACQHTVPPTEDNGLELTELMVHGAGTDSLEFIELYNSTYDPMSLAGAVVSGQVTFTFADTARDLWSGRYLVLASDTALFHARFPGVAVYGQYAGRLSNGGGSVTVTLAGKKLVDCNYGDNPPWPPLAAGGGYSLVYIGGDCKEASAWTAGTVLGGNPGKADKSTVPIGVRVNEVLPGLGGWVELASESDRPVDVSGWWLLDSVGDTSHVVLPPGSVVPASGYLLVPESLWTGTFFPARTGGHVILVKTESGVATSVATGLHYPALDSGLSAGWQAFPKGGAQEGQLSAPTPGAANLAALSVGPVVFWEIMYHPKEPLDVEYMVLHNVSADTVKLNDPMNPGKAWQLEGGGVMFPQDARLVPLGTLVLIRDELDTTAFRTKHAVPDSVRILTFPHSLSNSGETLVLKKPMLQAVVNGSLQWLLGWSDRVSYRDSLPWPVEADGQGKALSRRTIDAGSDPGAWIALDPGSAW